MPDNKNLNLADEFVARMRIGLVASESGGDYNAQNADSTAAGKYQFTKRWLTKGEHSIQKFAKASGVFKVPQSMEEFKANPNLQDAYFNYYAKNVLYPAAERLIQNNPENFTMDEIGAIIHFQGESAAKKQISSGVLSPATKKGVNGATVTNASGYEYLERFNRGLSNAGVGNISNDLTVPDKTREEIIADYQERNAAINALDIDDGPKEVLRKELHQQIFDEGNADIINSWVDKQNQINESEYNTEKADFQTMVDMFQNSSFLYRSKNGEQRITSMDLQKWDKEQEAKWQPIIEQYDKFFTEDTNGHVRVNFEKFLPYLEDGFKRFTDTEIDLVDDDNRTRAKDLSFDVSKPMKALNWLFGNDDPDTASVEFTSDFNFKEFEKQYGIDTTSLKKTKRQDPNVYPDAADDDTQNEPKDDGKATTKQADNSGTSLADEFFRTQLGLEGVNTKTPNYVPGKKELPIDAIMGMSMGLIGNSQAKAANIPLRTEAVDEAFKNYMAEMKKMSEHGLPVEVEAEMKRSLAEAYQGGLRNIANASGGNSAQVIANLGVLEKAKSEGLVAIQVADFEQKMKAYEAYGKATEYKNSVDMRRDIANHGILYQEEKEKQIRGRELATAGMAKLIDALAYDRENGPGSANDMYRSFLMQQMYGFDPKMPDDGSGTVKGTKSYFEKQYAEAQGKLQETTDTYERFNQLSPDAKGLLDTFVGENQNRSDVMAFSNYLADNPNLNLKTVDMSKMSEALAEGDFGLLGGRQIETAAAKTDFTQPAQQQGLLSPETSGSVATLGLPGNQNPATIAQEENNEGLLAALPGVNPIFDVNNIPQ